MQCRLCTTDVPETAVACPSCGARVDRTSGNRGRLRPDGGREEDPDDGDDPSESGDAADEASESSGEEPSTSSSDAVPDAPHGSGSAGSPDPEPASSEDTGGTNLGGAEPPGREPGGREPEGREPGGREPEGRDPVGRETAEPESGGAVERESARESAEGLIDRLPLAAGGFIGAVALLIPYVVITVVTFVAADRGDAVSTAANMFFAIVTLGSGQRFVDGFVSVSSITALGNVDPTDYPSVAAELEAAIELLQASPDAALLLLYVAGPWILYLGGRYLSRHYALEESALGHAIAGATVVVGTLPVLLVLGLAFSPPNLLPSLLLFGIGFPLVLGAVGGLSVYAFRRESAATSKLMGWIGVILGVLITFVLSPWLPYPLDLAQRMSVSAMVFLDVASAAVGFTLLTGLISILVVVTAVVAGFARAYLSRDDIEEPADGARIGASVVLGYVGAVALVGVAVPLSTIIIGVPFGAASAIAAAQPTVTDFLRIVLLGGIVFPLLFCAAGGYLAARQYLAE